MGPIAAIYRNGVFQPLEPVDLPDEQRVQVSIEPNGDQSVLAWLEEVRAVQAEILRRRGPLPDSSSEIAADRTR